MLNLSYCYMLVILTMKYEPQFNDFYMLMFNLIISRFCLQIKKEFGSFNKYLWGFVNNKPISTQYKACNKIPVKTSKSESISKDMVKRGFRYVGPTVIHSFMQAAGLTNDHLTTCPRHLQYVTLATQPPSTQ